ncbi:heat shock protein 70 [Colletotrichum incanum]|nr:heat shock protein 70 [Colletotrichum incanum]
MRRSMVCKTTEPEFFMHAVIRNPCSSDGLGVARHQGLITREPLSEILRELKDTAETWAQHGIESAVVAVPTYFSEMERSAVKQAGTSVGLEVVRIVSSSIAIGIGHGLDKSNDESVYVVFYELGRENFEVSVAEVDMGVFGHRTTINDPRIGKEVGGIIEEKRSVGATHFSPAEMGLFEQTLAYVERVIQEANLSRTDIAHLVVTGDYTPAQQVRSMIEAFFNGKSALDKDDRDDSFLVPGTLDHDESITYGAAILADILVGYERSVEVLGRLSLQSRTLSVETIGGESLRVFQRWTMLPASKTLNFTTTVDGQQTVVISVFQGELPEVRKNDEVVSLTLDCIPPSPRGIPKVTLILDVYPDEVGNLMLNATAHLIGANGNCFDTSPAVLHDFYADGFITTEDLELEAAFVYDRTGAGLPGSCVNRQSELEQQHITTEWF